MGPVIEGEILSGEFNIDDDRFDLEEKMSLLEMSYEHRRESFGNEIQNIFLGERQ